MGVDYQEVLILKWKLMKKRKLIMVEKKGKNMPGHEGELVNHEFIVNFIEPDVRVHSHEEIEEYLSIPREG